MIICCRFLTKNDFSSYFLSILLFPTPTKKVFPSRNGFQINVNDNDEWVDVKIPTRGNVAIMVFGWCTQIRSNGRIPACLHRVTDDDDGDVDEDDLTSDNKGQDETNVIVPRRIAAVLFCAPKRPETPLEPVILDGEERVYISGVKAGQLRGKMARKWQKREGTIRDTDRILEEEEILATKMYTQDDVIQKTIAV